MANFPFLFHSEAPLAHQSHVLVASLRSAGQVTNPPEAPALLLILNTSCSYTSESNRVEKQHFIPLCAHVTSPMTAALHIKKQRTCRIGSVW